MELKELQDLRILLSETNDRQVASLAEYHDKTSNGFYHRHDKRVPGKLSRSSTATCVLSLVATGEWWDRKWGERSFDLAREMLLRKWTSAALPVNNAFTVGFIIEAATLLEEKSEDIRKDPECAERLRVGEKTLVKALRRGCASVQGYPPSAYVTQLATRALLRRGKLSPSSQEKIRGWARREIENQLALVMANSKSADSFQLGYSLVLAASLGAPAEATPDERAILDAGLDCFFKSQRDDGTWPRSRPLFHYPEVGSAHCYEYEFLAQLLQQESLQATLLGYLPQLKRSTTALTQAAFQLKEGGLGWSSGHHPQLRGPESWSTASVYHFAHVLDRLVAEAIRREVFSLLDSPYRPPLSPKKDEADFAPGFLDCPLNHGGTVGSLRSTVFARFVKPVSAEAAHVAAGFSLSEGTPMSAILFGPPGTSKTELAKRIAEFLSWPLLTIDPSHFVRNGMDRVYAEADRIFGILASAERIVVLLDEFDEMVRERGTAPDVLSRFLTTAMLPKLATINKHRRLVYIVATNHIEHFDVAISRQGRFDIILQVMPPTLEEKLKKWESLSGIFDNFSVAVTQEPLRDKLEALTFLEFKQLAVRLHSAKSAQEVLAIIDHAHLSCTLNTLREQGEKSQNWADACVEQAHKVRLPSC